MAVYSQQPTMCWAPGHHGVCPQWWRPIQTACKLSTAPCTALLPYSWPCGLLIIHKGKPWTHQIPPLTGFFILCPSWFLMSVGTLLSRQQSGQCLFWIVLVFVNYCGTFLLGCCKYILACMVHVVDVDAWLCILSSPTMCWAPGHHGVCPQWWRPIQTAGKLSTAPCTALLPYSWPCGLLIIHKGKPWTHQIPPLTGFFILCPSWFLMSVRTLLSRQQSGQCLFCLVLVFVNYCGTFLLGCCKYILACMVQVVDVDAWLCILSSPPCAGHLVIMVYVRSGGVLYRLLASWVLLLARHCFHIPGPVGYW